MLLEDKPNFTFLGALTLIFTKTNVYNSILMLDDWFMASNDTGRTNHKLVITSIKLLSHIACLWDLSGFYMHVVPFRQIFEVFGLKSNMLWQSYLAPGPCVALVCQFHVPVSLVCMWEMVLRYFWLLVYWSDWAAYSYTLPPSNSLSFWIRSFYNFRLFQEKVNSFLTMACI